MKRFLKRYLLLQPTFFSWLCLVGCLAAVAYLAFGIVAITQSAEGIMVLLFVPYFIAITLFIFAADYILRTLVKGKLFWISFIELILFAGFASHYYQTKLYKVQLVINHPTDLVILVEDNEKGLEIKKGPLQFRFNVQVPENNIVFLESASYELLWYNLRIRSSAGLVFTNFYPMQYSDSNSVRCGNKDYNLEFIQLEMKGQRLPSMDDRMFDSVHRVVCNALSGK